MADTFDYSNLSATAVRMVSKFGRTMQSRVMVSSGEPWNPTQTPIDTDIKGVMTAFKANEIDGTLIMSSDKQLLTTSTLDTSSLIVDGGIQYSVVSVNIVQTGTPIILYKAQLRR